MTEKNSKNLDENINASYADYAALMSENYDPSIQQPTHVEEQTTSEESEYARQEENELGRRAHRDEHYQQSQQPKVTTTQQSNVDNENNDSIYISDLPLDITVENLKKHFGSIGVVKIDKRTREPKISIYRDRDTGQAKGDALLVYDDPSAAKAAIEWFNDKEFMGKHIHVEYAQKKSSSSSKFTWKR